jgi:hypothetical protein
MQYQGILKLKNIHIVLCLEIQISFQGKRVLPHVLGPLGGHQGPISSLSYSVHIHPQTMSETFHLLTLCSCCPLV